MSSKVATSHVWRFKFKFIKIKSDYRFISSVALNTFQVLPILESADTEHFHHYRKFCWPVLAYISHDSPSGPFRIILSLQTGILWAALQPSGPSAGEWAQYLTVIPPVWLLRFRYTCTPSRGGRVSSMDEKE